MIIGLFSFLVFSYCRMRWPLSFAPRTKLKGETPHHVRKLLFISSFQVSPLTKPTRIKHFLGGYCLRYELQNLQSSKSLVLMPRSWVTCHPPSRVKSDCNHKIPVVKLLQDVVLFVLCLLHICDGDPHANQLQGECRVTIADRRVLMKVAE
jgi:hypothetical protein